MTQPPEIPADEPSPRSSDEESIGWGDEREELPWRRESGGSDPDLERLLADRPPHHDQM